MRGESTLLSALTWRSRQRHRTLLNEAPRLQARAFRRLLAGAQGTRFADDHRLSRVRELGEYQRKVPLRSYTDYEPYWQQIRASVPDVLLAGKPRYWARTGGTTSAEKLIPIYRQGIAQSRGSFGLGLAVHRAQHPGMSLLGARILYLGSCAPLSERDGLPTGFMSSILASELPAYTRALLLPGKRVDHIPDWQTKTERIFELMQGQRISMVAGMPPWLCAFFRHLVERTGRPVLDTWPDISLVLHSGVAMDSYREAICELLAGDARERLPRFMNGFGSTEGNFAFQDDETRSDMLLISDEVCFEFVPMDELLANKETARRLSLHEVRIGEDYALVLNTPGGLYGYLIGDTVRFTSLAPPRIVITGRTAQMLNHAGEKVSVEQLTRALASAATEAGARITEFSVCPARLALGDNAHDFAPGHRWLVEFAEPPHERARFIAALDSALSAENPLYALRRRANVGRTPLFAAPALCELPPGSFARWQAAQGRLGGHFKIPRVASEAQLASLMEE
jgi:hypothetical protein